MSEIMTFTRKMFDPIQPDMDRIDIADIAHALSMLSRTNGRFPSFYSVAQHCVNCTKEAKERGCLECIQLACLLHNDTETYLSDITRLVKAELPRHKEIEAPLQEKIRSKWLGDPLTMEERTQVFAIDEANFRTVCAHWRAGEITTTAAMQEVGLKLSAFCWRVKKYAQKT